MIQGGSGVVSCDCENLDFFLNLWSALNNIEPLNNILLHYSFCNYHSFIILENIMETLELFVPRSNNHGRGQPQKNVLLGRMGEGSGHQRQCYNCGKSGHLANVCPSKYKVATKTDKRKREKLYQLLTSLIQP